MSDDRVEGQEDTGAAMVMGNSTRVWKTNYDTQYHTKLANNVVAAMGKWRANMAVRESRPLKQARRGGGAGHVTACVIHDTSDDENHSSDGRAEQ